MSSSLYLALECQVNKGDGTFYWKSVSSPLDDYENLSLRDSFRDDLGDLPSESNYSKETLDKLRINDFLTGEEQKDIRYYDSYVLYLSDIHFLKDSLEVKKEKYTTKLNIQESAIESPIAIKLNALNKKLDSIYNKLKDNEEQQYDEEDNSYDALLDTKEAIKNVDDIIYGLNDIQCLANSALQKESSDAQYNGHLARVICWIC